MSDRTRERTVVSLRAGARVGLTLAALLLVFAAYHAWMPVDITARGGVQFECGSVVNPPNSTFAKNVCGSLVDRQRLIMIFSIIGAVVLAAGAVYSFGIERRHEQITLDEHTSEDVPPETPAT